MATTTNAKAARKAAREATLEANAELIRRSRLNVESLTTFFTAMGKAETVDQWLAEKMAVLREQSSQRREQQHREAGAALLDMRGRGEQVRDIAKLAGISVVQVRELIRLAELPASADDAAGADGAGAAGAGDAGAGDAGAGESAARRPRASAATKPTLEPEPVGSEASAGGAASE